MHLRLKTEPVTAGTDAWYSSGFCFHTVHFCICTGHEKQTDWVFMPELRLFLGHFNYCCYFLVSRSWFLSVADLTLHSNLSVFLFCWYYNCKKYKNKKRKGKRTLMDRCSWPTASWVMPGQLAASLSSMTWRRWDFIEAEDFLTSEDFTEIVNGHVLCTYSTMLCVYLQIIIS